MKETMTLIWTTVRESYAGNLIFPLYLASLVYLAVTDRKNSKKIVGPSVILMLILFNPVLYDRVFIKTLSSAYWRSLWLIPAVPVVACAVIRLFGHLPARWMKAVAAADLAVLIVFGGTFVYTGSGREVTKAENLYKLPQDAVDVSRELLRLSDEPHVVMDRELFCYTRQYSSRIIQMYGRDAWGYMDDIRDDCKAVYDELQKQAPDYGFVAGSMRDQGFTYLVQSKEGEDQAAVEQAGFRLVSEIDGFSIWELTPLAE